jgi:hypothetical protein
MPGERQIPGPAATVHRPNRTIHTFDPRPGRRRRWRRPQPAPTRPTHGVLDLHIRGGPGSGESPLRRTVPASDQGTCLNRTTAQINRPPYVITGALPGTLDRVPRKRRGLRNCLPVGTGMARNHRPARPRTISAIIMRPPHFRTGNENWTPKPVPEGLRICVLQRASGMAIRYAPALIEMTFREWEYE